MQCWYDVCFICIYCYRWWFIADLSIVRTPSWMVYVYAIIIEVHTIVINMPNSLFNSITSPSVNVNVFFFSLRALSTTATCWAATDRTGNSIRLNSEWERKKEKMGRRANRTKSKSQGICCWFETWNIVNWIFVLASFKNNNNNYSFDANKILSKNV